MRVVFREFQERDVDFVYRCKNDKTLNSLVVGTSNPVTHDDAVNWVWRCINADSSFHFWAIATNDEEQNIVGWLGLSNIDDINKSAHFYSILIGDDDYRDSFAWIEAYLYIMNYVFETLKFHRLSGSHLSVHLQSDAMFRCMFFKQEGISRDAKVINNRFCDVIQDGLLSDEYFLHLENGDYEVKKIFRRLVEINRVRIQE